VAWALLDAQRAKRGSRRSKDSLEAAATQARECEGHPETDVEVWRELSRKLLAGGGNDMVGRSVSLLKYSDELLE
jgi:hypothetical protein